MYKHPFKNFLLVIGAAFLLCYAAYSNGYPLTYPDTGTYIHSGFQNKVPEDRPILYGLFVRHISLNESLYFVVLAQGMLLAYLLFLYFKHMVSAPYKRVGYVLLVLLLTFFTGASVNVSQLIPDVFTPIMILSLGLLISSSLNTKEMLFVAVVYVFAFSTHLSHTLLCFIILLFLTLSSFFFFKTEALVNRKMLFKIWALFLAASFVIPSVHFLFNGKFRSSNASHVFLMYKINEMGILDNYLNKNCAKLNLKICAFEGNIPTDFIWDEQNSPAYQFGGWEANKAEYDFIIRDVLTSPHYLKIFLEKAVSNSISQFFSFSTGDTPRAGPLSPPHEMVKWHFKEDLRQFEMSAQNGGRLDYTFLNNRQLLLVILSAFVVFVLCSIDACAIPLAVKQAGVIIISGLVANAIVCGSLSCVVPRYQSRVIWLLPIFACILLLNQWKAIKSWVAGANFKTTT